MKEYDLEEQPKEDIDYLKEDILNMLYETSLQDEPNKYITLLDKYEQLELAEKQSKRRDNMKAILDSDGTLTSFLRDE